MLLNLDPDEREYHTALGLQSRKITEEHCSRTGLPSIWKHTIFVWPCEGSGRQHP